MGRVNVEGRAMAEGRFFNLMARLQTDRVWTIGFLVCFWHDSQQRLIEEGSKNEIIKLIPPVKGKSGAEIFEALLDAEYLIKIEDHYRIKGNRKHVEFWRSHRERSINAGKRSGEIRRIKSKTSNRLVQSSNRAGSIPEPNTIQINTDQIRSNTQTPSDPVSPDASVGKSDSVTTVPRRTAFDFEALYRRYPRKQGKKDGLRVARRDVKTEADYERLGKAIDNYVRHVHESRTEARFVKQFSSFMSSWEDWLDADAGKVVVKAQPVFDFGGKNVPGRVDTGKT